MSRPFDLILLGATGFTGGLVARRLVNRGLRVLIAGRDEQRLAERVQELGLGFEYSVISLDDSRAMTDLAGRAPVLLNAVGPFDPSVML